jgi:hypothetical protein
MRRPVTLASLSMIRAMSSSEASCRPATSRAIFSIPPVEAGDLLEPAVFIYLNFIDLRIQGERCLEGTLEHEESPGKRKRQGSGGMNM